MSRRARIYQVFLQAHMQTIVVKKCLNSSNLHLRQFIFWHTNNPLITQMQMVTTLQKPHKYTDLTGKITLHCLK
jgi:hypothetical protein